jgi:hypothetical protein
MARDASRNVFKDYTIFQKEYSKMKRIILSVLMFLTLHVLMIFMSCGGGFESDSSNADDIGDEIFGSDSGK